MRSWSHDAATVPVQNARPHSGSYSLSICGGSSGGVMRLAIHGRRIVGGAGAHAVPVADAPLVAEVGAPEVEGGADALPDALAGGGVDLGAEQRRILVVGGDDLPGLGVGREPGREDAAGGEAAHVGGPSDHQVDEADEVVAHVVERVAPRRAGRAALAAQVDGVGLEVLGQQRQRVFVAPPRLGLAGDEQERRLRASPTVA